MHTFSCSWNPHYMPGLKVLLDLPDLVLLLLSGSDCDSFISKLGTQIRILGYQKTETTSRGLHDLHFFSVIIPEYCLILILNDNTYILSNFNSSSALQLGMYNYLKSPKP